MSISASDAVGATAPPAIPPVRASGVWDQADDLLVWVRTGAASVRAATHEHLVTEGQGIWIPMEPGDEWVITTEPGTVAVPILTDPTVGAKSPLEPRRFDVPDAWQDWLIHSFNLRVTPLSSQGYSQNPLADLLAHPRVPAGELADAAVPTSGPPVMPRTGPARAVADDLLSDPALDLSITEWSARVLTSPRTLLRSFRAETGLTFAQWRTRCRLDAAIDHLAAGHDVAHVASRVGFATANGFTRAFTRQFGVTPFAFGRPAAASSAARRRARRAVAERQAGELLRMMRPNAATSPPDRLPAARTTSHTNDVHVLIWTYRGSGYVDIGGRRLEQERGVATWIPAGAEHTTGVREDSISLPLGNAAAAADLPLDEPLHVRFPPEWEDYLLFCSISARTPLRPANDVAADVIGLFVEQVEAQRALSLPMPVHPGARALATAYLRSIGTVGAAHLDASAEIHRAFREETGMTLPRWRYAARMRIARDLLAGGSKATAVARRVGYAHLPTFSAAFTRFHGVSPRDYQDSTRRRESNPQRRQI